MAKKSSGNKKVRPTRSAEDILEDFSGACGSMDEPYPGERRYDNLVKRTIKELRAILAPKRR